MAKIVPMKRTAHTIEIKTKNHGSSMPMFALRGSSINSIWSDCPLIEDLHINAAKHGADWLFPEINSELFGSRNEGKGGGGIVRMEFGGSAFTQSKQDVTSY